MSRLDDAKEKARAKIIKATQLVCDAQRIMVTICPGGSGPLVDAMEALGRAQIAPIFTEKEDIG